MPDLRALLELLEQERIRVVIPAERALSDAVVALEESKRGAISGKLVITVDVPSLFLQRLAGPGVSERSSRRAQDHSVRATYF